MVICQLLVLFIGKRNLLREKQAKEKEALEAKLALQGDGGDVMKVQALNEIKSGNYEKAEATLSAIVNAAVAKVVDTLLELAQVKELQMQYMDALDFAEQALDFEPESAAALLYAGKLADTVGDTDTAIEYYERNIALEKKSGNDEDILATSYANLARALYNKVEYEKAISAAKKAIALYKKKYAENDAVYAQVYETLSDIYYTTGDAKKGTDYSYKAMEIAVAAYGENSLEAAIAYSNLVMRLNFSGDFDNAIALGEKALDILLAIKGENDTEVALVYNSIGEAYQEKGEPENAIGYFEKSLEINNQLLDPKHPEIVHTKKNLGRAQKELSRVK